VVRQFGLVFAASLLVVAGCGGGSDDGAHSRRPIVFAAASLTEVFTDLGGASFSFAGSQALVAQIEQGAPTDVVAVADTAQMDVLREEGLVERPVVFAHNRLEIAVAPGNPEDVHALRDLARDDLVVVLADPSVPVGRYSRQVLDRAGVTVRPRSLELDVKAALAKVSGGEADATIVYQSDVRAAGDEAAGVAIPDDQNVVASFPIAVVKDAAHRKAATAFVQRVLSGRGQRILRLHGFLPGP
jgi:molybdate transport system substrate-binding protein